MLGNATCYIWLCSFTKLNPASSSASFVTSSRTNHYLTDMLGGRRVGLLKSAWHRTSMTSGCTTTDALSLNGCAQPHHFTCENFSQRDQLVSYLIDGPFESTHLCFSFIERSMDFDCYRAAQEFFYASARTFAQCRDTKRSSAIGRNWYSLTSPSGDTADLREMGAAEESHCGC